MLGKLLILVYCGRVAQLDRVPGYEPGGRRFDSCRVRHIEKASQMTGFFLFNILLHYVGILLKYCG